MINYRRGKLDVIDRKGVEAVIWECYLVVKLEFDRLLADITIGDPEHINGPSDCRALNRRPNQNHPETLRKANYMEPGN